MLGLWNNLTYPEMIAKNAAESLDFDFFKLHQELLDDLEMNQSSIEMIEFFHISLQQVVIKAGNAKLWAIVSEMIGKLHQDVFVMTDTKGQRTILHYAIEWGNCDVVQLLVNLMPPEAFAKQDNDLETVLHRATGKGHFEMVQILLKKMPLEALAKQDACQSTAFHIAAERGHLDIIQMLIQHMPHQETLMKQDDLDRTALHWASEYGHQDIVEMLLKQMPPGSSEFLVKRDVNQRTALHWAAQCGHVKIVQMLVKQMAPDDIVQQDRQGHTALTLAQKYGHCNTFLLD